MQKSQAFELATAVMIRLRIHLFFFSVKAFIILCVKAAHVRLY